MAVVITIDAHDFIGGPDAHRPYHTIKGSVLCANPYTPGGELFGAAELQAAVQAALGRTDITVTTVHQLEVGESSSDAATFRMNAAGTRLVAINRPVDLTEAWSAALVVAGHTTNVPAGGIPVAVAATVGGVVGPCIVGHDAPAVTRHCRFNPTTRALDFLAADAVTEARALLIDRTVAEEYGAVNISTISAKFLAVVS